MVLKEMTLDEKMNLLHGHGMPGWQDIPKRLSRERGTGFVLGVPRLGIPMIHMSDAAYGVRSSAQNARYSTALPWNIAAAASWDTNAACEYGALIGRELRERLQHDARWWREYNSRAAQRQDFRRPGRRPILAGTLVGNRIKCEQAQHVIGDIKHYAVSEQESGRNGVNATISKRAMRESDLLAFEIGIEIGNPAAVTCSYNAVNGHLRLREQLPAN
ncbi:MAG: glycoside hydrolase family 3 N-terminal domain-containing protein [Bryobacteraceae bacterium]